MSETTPEELPVTDPQPDPEPQPEPEAPYAPDEPPRAEEQPDQPDPDAPPAEVPAGGDMPCPVCGGHMIKNIGDPCTGTPPQPEEPPVDPNDVEVP